MNHNSFSSAIRVVRLLIVFGILSLSGMTLVGAQDKPNIVFIMADDLGYTDLGCYGNPFNETPHIDSLAGSGMRFTQAYSSSPVCSPSRAGLLTGIHPARLHLTNFLVGERTDPASPVIPAEWRKYLPSKEITFAEVLRDEGFTCGMVGKWHLGNADSLRPVAQGFDFERVIGKNGLDYYNYSITDRDKGVVFEDYGEHYLTDKLTDYAVEFIQEKKDDRFLLYLSYSAPHVVLVPRGDKLKKYFFKHEKFDGKFNPNYAAMIESMDDGVGRILETLRELKLDDNTIVVFTSDNGGVGLPELGPIPTNLEPLRAWKGHVYEGGIRVPLIVRWPNRIRSGADNDNYVVNTDFFPTFLDILNVRNSHRDRDGKSMLPTWLNPTAQFNRGPAYWHYPHFSNQLGRPAGAIRKGDFKLVELYENGEIELYDLSSDIGEENDLSDRRPEKVKELLVDFRKWQKDVKANMPRPNPNYKK